jgi:hypothetical protein
MSDSELHLEKLIKAVQRKCRECCGGSFKEVEECDMDKCALWPWRTTSPATAGEGPPPPAPEPIPSAKIAGATEEEAPNPEKKPSSKKSSDDSQHTLF